MSSSKDNDLGGSCLVVFSLTVSALFIIAGLCLVVFTIGHASYIFNGIIAIILLIFGVFILWISLQSYRTVYKALIVVGILLLWFTLSCIVGSLAHFENA